MAGSRNVRGGPGGEPVAEESENAWSRFGARLRAAREARGVSVTEVAERALTGAATLEAVEAGQLDPGRRVVAILDAEFGAQGVLWDAWAQVFLSAHVREGGKLQELFFQASQVRCYAPLVLPEAYLTSAYADALNRVERPMEGSEVCGDRPHVPRLMAAQGGPAFHCLIVDEVALHRMVGDPTIVREQLAHLHALARSAYVSVYVIPAATAHHPGLRGAFWTLSFSPRHGLAYIPHPRGPGQLVTDATHIKGYTDLYATLHTVAHSAEASLTLLTEAIEAPTSRKAITTGQATPNPLPREEIPAHATRA